MCMVGDPAEFNVDAPEVEVKEYLCSDCGNKFKSLGKNILCPTCKSGNVTLAKS